MKLRSTLRSALRTHTSQQWMTPFSYFTHRATTLEAVQSIKTDHKEDIEPNLLALEAEPRSLEFSGRRFRNDNLREIGKLPALLVSIPEGETVTQRMLSINTKQFHRIIKTVGGNCALMSHVLRLEIPQEDKVYRVLARQLRLSNENFKPNNATFRVLHKTDIVRVSIPIVISGEDTCPGLKQNGFPLIVKHALTVKCRGDHIPPHLVADISRLEIRHKVFAKDISLPKGCEYLNVDPMTCVCKISPFK